MRNLCTEYLFQLYDEGLMNDYSEDHFLIKAMNGKFDFLNEYGYLVNDTTYLGSQKSTDVSFLMNFSTKLKFLANTFSEKDIKEFVKNQLAAGKENYSEEQFFRALSEIHVLSFLSAFGYEVEECIYEPRLNLDNSNPEARIKYKNEIIIDVEVKTPGFIKREINSNNKRGNIKPNLFITNDGIDKIKKYCEENELNLIMPRVLKLKTFIESAAKKFVKPSSSKHFNVLFINWTYTDFSECGLCEPITLLANPISGILYNNTVLKLLKINPKDLDKISAIVLYKDNINSILFGDFRYHWQDKSLVYLINMKNNYQTNFNILSDILHTNPYNDSAQIEWWPLDFEYKEGVTQNEIEDTCNFVSKVIFQSNEFISELYGNIDGKLLMDMMLLKRKINKY